MNKKIEGISDEFQELGNELMNQNFSNNADKEKIYKNSLNKINRKEGIYMIKNKLKKAGIVAASLMILAVASNPTYAANTASKFINDITFGKVSFFQNTEAGVEPIRDCFKGKIFDKDGNELTSLDINAIFYDKTEKIYTKDGKEIAYLKDDNIVTVEEANKDVITIDDKDSINQYATFNYKFPQSVPEGYEFKNAKYEKTKGVTDGKEWYMQTLVLFYEDKATGNKFSLNETYSEVPFSYVNNKKMEAIKVNGNDGVLYETGVISWVMDDISYTIGSDKLDKDAKLQIAESIK